MATISSASNEQAMPVNYRENFHTFNSDAEEIAVNITPCDRRETMSLLYIYIYKEKIRVAIACETN